MTQEQIISRFEDIIEFAEENYIRLLIEIDPSYETVYIYTDNAFYSHIAMLINKYGLSDIRRSFIKEIKWTLTNEKMFYPDNKPKLVILQQNKQKINHRFYKSNVDVKILAENNIKIYFVAINGKFSREVVNSFRLLISLMDDKDIKQLGDTLEEYNFSEEYKFNRLGYKKFALYKY